MTEAHSHSGDERTCRCLAVDYTRQICLSKCGRGTV